MDAAERVQAGADLPPRRAPHYRPHLAAGPQRQGGGGGGHPRCHGRQRCQDPHLHSSVGPAGLLSGLWNKWI